MDPKDKQIEELTAKVKEFETTVTKLQDTLSVKEAAIKEKDRVIQEKNMDIVGLRNANKNIKKLSDEEKAELGERERAEYEEKLALQEKIEALEKQQQEYVQKQVESKREAKIRELAGGDENLAEKIRLNFEKIKGSETAQTDEEINEYVSTARNMLGNVEPKAPAMRFDDTGGDGVSGEEKKENDFAETNEGKQLNNLLGL